MLRNKWFVISGVFLVFSIVLWAGDMLITNTYFDAYAEAYATRNAAHDTFEALETRGAPLGIVYAPGTGGAGDPGPTVTPPIIATIQALETAVAEEQLTEASLRVTMQALYAEREVLITQREALRAQYSVAMTAYQNANTQLSDMTEIVEKQSGASTVANQANLIAFGGFIVTGFLGILQERREARRERRNEDEDEDS